MSLVKRIPSKAGLGGGSSDAAAALRLCAQLWGLCLDDGHALDLCAALGSDVPFFWRGGTAVVTGRGEYLVPVAAVADVAFRPQRSRIE